MKAQGRSSLCSRICRGPWVGACVQPVWFNKSGPELFGFETMTRLLHALSLSAGQGHVLSKADVG